MKHGEAVPTEDALPTRDAVPTGEMAPTGEAISIKGTAQANDVLLAGEGRQAPKETLRTREVLSLGGVHVVPRPKRPLVIVLAERPALIKMLQALAGVWAMLCTALRRLGRTKREAIQTSTAREARETGEDGTSGVGGSCRELFMPG